MPEADWIRAAAVAAAPQASVSLLARLLQAAVALQFDPAAPCSSASGRVSSNLSSSSSSSSSSNSPHRDESWVTFVLRACQVCVISHICQVCERVDGWAGGAWIWRVCSILQQSHWSHHDLAHSAAGFVGSKLTFIACVFSFLKVTRSCHAAFPFCLGSTRHVHTISKLRSNICFILTQF